MEASTPKPLRVPRVTEVIFDREGVALFKVQRVIRSILATNGVWHFYAKTHSGFRVWVDNQIRPDFRRVAPGAPRSHLVNPLHPGEDWRLTDAP